MIVGIEARKVSTTRTRDMSGRTFKCLRSPRSANGRCNALQRNVADGVRAPLTSSGTRPRKRAELVTPATAAATEQATYQALTNGPVRQEHAGWEFPVRRWHMAVFGRLDNIPCEERGRTVRQDVRVNLRGLSLQLPDDRHEPHYILVMGYIFQRRGCG